jgi:hypothetical protein
LGIGHAFTAAHSRGVVDLDGVESAGGGDDERGKETEDRRDPESNENGAATGRGH